MKKGDVKRNEILKFVEVFSNENGYPPSVREICAGVSLKSPSTVFGHLRILADEGKLKYEEGRKRAISVADSPKAFLMNKSHAVPLLGRVTAGEPILAVEEATDFVPYAAAKSLELFALKIVGESMKNAGILDNDIIVVERASTAANGDIVVALLDDDATVKRFYKEKGHFRLQPENDAFEPIIVKKLSLLGKVIGLIREY